MEQNENTLSVLKIAPGQYPQQVEIDNDLKTLQQAVGCLLYTSPSPRDRQKSRMP